MHWRNIVEVYEVHSADSQSLADRLDMFGFIVPLGVIHSSEVASITRVFKRICEVENGTLRSLFNEQTF